MLKPTPDDRISYDSGSGLLRSFFGLGQETGLVSVDAPATDIAAGFLESNGDLLKLDGIGLTLEHQADSGSQLTCRYVQNHLGIPVYGAYLNVTIRKSDNRVVSCVNRLDYNISPGAGPDQAVFTADQAIQSLQEREQNPAGDGVWSEPELTWFRQMLVWRIGLDSRASGKHSEFMVNAMDGSLVAEIDRRRFYGSRSARVFWPDPVTSSGDPHLHWNSPANRLEEECREVMLENLLDPVNGTWRLHGKWVKIAEKEDPVARQASTQTDFSYPVNDRNFLGVMAYYYLDRLVEWLLSLDVPALDNALNPPLEVDPLGVQGADNSHFAAPVSGPVYIAFGEGGTPDASDPGVVTHEFGHALHYFLLGRLAEAGSCEEGFNDFLSCVFRDRFNVRGFDRANPFPWDNNLTDRWDATRRCDVKYRFDDRGFSRYGLYRKGTIFASALWEIYLMAGGDSSNPGDRLTAAGEITATYLEMLVAVGDTGPVEDLVNGLVSADCSRSGGKLERVIREAFGSRGLYL